MNRKIIILFASIWLLSIPLISASPVANFTYTTTGANIFCTSTSTNTNSSTEYKWEVKDDTSTIVGSTPYSTAQSTFIHTAQDGGTFYITLYTKYESDISSYTRSTGKLNVNKDKLEPEEYLSCKSCRENGFHWYDDSCHKEDIPLPWNIQTELEEAGEHEKYSIQMGKWNISLPYLIIIAIACIVIFYILRRQGYYEYE